jgi:hypothetical protein
MKFMVASAEYADHFSTVTGQRCHRATGWRADPVGSVGIVWIQPVLVAVKVRENHLYGATFLIAADNEPRNNISVVGAGALQASSLA